MKMGDLKPAKLNVWGNSLLNKLKSIPRKRVKREASKRRRVALREKGDRNG